MSEAFWLYMGPEDYTARVLGWGALHSELTARGEDRPGREAR